MGIGMRSVYWVELLRLIPTKEKLDRGKLDRVLGWFDPEDLRRFEPLVVECDPALNLYLVDGHCRAWAAWATGVEKLPVVVRGQRAAPPTDYFKDLSALQPDG